jgi:hypothetical protein
MFDSSHKELQMSKIHELPEIAFGCCCVRIGPQCKLVESGPSVKKEVKEKVDFVLNLRKYAIFELLGILFG